MKKYCIYPGCCNLVSNGYCEKHRNMSKRCIYPRCSEYAEEGSNYCKEHSIRKRADNKRGSSRSRGYDYKWEKVRKEYITRHPLCERCESLGIITSAVLVHHKVRLADGGEAYNPDNLMSLCYRCHEEIHMEHGDYKGSIKTSKPIKKLTLDDVYSL